MRAFPYTDDALIGRLTEYWIARGERCLQAQLQGTNEHAHCRWLLAQLAPPMGASVLDIGSGVGAVADIMKSQRPDLRFTLLNISRWQLEHSNPKHARVCADLESLPFAAGAFDCALLIYAIGYGMAARVLAEATRVARLVLVYDVIANERREWRRKLFYRIPKISELRRYGEPQRIDEPNGGRFEPLLPGFWKRTGAKTILMRITSP